MTIRFVSVDQMQTRANDVVGRELASGFVGRARLVRDLTELLPGEIPGRVIFGEYGKSQISVLVAGRDLDVFTGLENRSAVLGFSFSWVKDVKVELEEAVQMPGR